MDVFTPMLLLKLTLVPALIIGITFAGQRWGFAVAGWLSGFPVIAGPVLLFIALDHGTSFAQQAALATLTAVPANTAFGITYARLAQILPWFICLPAAMAVFALVAFALHGLPVSLSIVLPVFIVVLAFLLLAPRLFPSVAAAARTQPASRIEMACRVLAGGTVAFLISLFANQLGAQWSGFLSVFPVVGGVLAVFTHRLAHADAVTHLLRGQATGFFAFSTFCVVLIHVLPFGLVAGFSCALVTAGLVQRLTLRITLHR